MGKLSKKLGILITSILVLCSCKNGSSVDFERTSISVNGQHFEILTAHEIFDSYIEEEHDYSLHIYQMIQSEFGDSLEYPFLMDAIRAPINPDEALSEELALMEKMDFVKIVDATFQSVTDKLPGPDTKILFLPANPINRKFYQEFGIGFHAFTIGAGKIIVSFDPTFDNWQQLLPYALAHEYHHSVWTSMNFRSASFTPLEYLVLEGKADYFASQLFPDSGHPFIGMLDKDDEVRIWNFIKPEIHKRNSEINNQLFYGSNEIPYGTVYAIGYKIIESFKKNNPLISDRVLMDFPAEKVLQQSNYGN